MRLYRFSFLERFFFQSALGFPFGDPRNFVFILRVHTNILCRNIFKHPRKDPELDLFRQVAHQVAQGLVETFPHALEIGFGPGIGLKYLYIHMDFGAFPFPLE